MKIPGRISSVIVLKVEGRSPRHLQAKLIKLARECRGYSIEYLEELGFDAIADWEVRGSSGELSRLEEVLKVPRGVFDVGDKTSRLIELQVSAGDSDRLQGKIIKLGRLAKGLSQQSLADHLGVHRSTVAHWERMGIGQEIYKLAEVLGLEYGAFRVKE